MMKTCYRYTMEYYSAVKKDDILSFAATQIDLEGIVLSGVSQTEKEKHCMVLFTYGI